MNNTFDNTLKLYKKNYINFKYQKGGTDYKKKTLSGKIININDIIKSKLSKDDIFDSSLENNIKAIKINKIKIYRLRELNETNKPNFSQVLTFVYKPEDLWMLLNFRIFQVENEKGKHDTRYLKNLYVDIYEINKPIFLIIFVAMKYIQLENFINDISPNYNKIYDEDSNGDRIKIYNQLINNKNFKIDGFFEKSSDKLREEKKLIDEIILLPSSKNKIKYLKSKKVGDILDKVFETKT